MKPELSKPIYYILLTIQVHLGFFANWSRHESSGLASKCRHWLTPGYIMYEIHMEK